jgi:hypothetical protein
MDLILLPPLLSLLGVLAEPLASALALVIACTTLAAGFAHYAAVLAGKSKARIERMTGFGFFFGICVGAFAVLVALLSD